MSSKLIKQSGHLLEIPGDETLIDLKVFKSGKIQLQAPVMTPQDVCKCLQNISVDVMFAAFAQAQEKRIDTLQGREDA